MSVAPPPSILACRVSVGSDAAMMARLPTPEAEALALLSKCGGYFKVVSDLSPRDVHEDAAFRESGLFVRMGVVAARSAAVYAGLDWGEFSTTRSAFCVTLRGGAEFARLQGSMLRDQGPLAVSKYLSTGWFPASLAGHLSILGGVGGACRTVTSSSGGIAAVRLAVSSLSSGICDEAVVVAADCADTCGKPGIEGGDAREERVADAGCALILAPSSQRNPRIVAVSLRGHTTPAGAEMAVIECCRETLSRARIDPGAVDLVIVTMTSAYPAGLRILDRIGRLFDDARVDPLVWIDSGGLTELGSVPPLLAVSIAAALLENTNSTQCLRRLSEALEVGSSGRNQSSDSREPKRALVLALDGLNSAGCILLETQE